MVGGVAEVMVREDRGKTALVLKAEEVVRRQERQWQSAFLGGMLGGVEEV